jgi:hypothetical protein
LIHLREQYDTGRPSFRRGRYLRLPEPWPSLFSLDDMTASERIEIERVLRNHREWIREDYEKAKDKHSYAYLRLSGYLRILLVDRKLPVLLRYAKARGKTLYAYVPNFDLRELNGQPVWGWSGFVIGSNPEKGSKRIPIEEFLDRRAIGVYSNEQGVACTYTPRQLIEYTANRDGVAHLDLKNRKELEAMKLMAIVDERGRCDSQEIKHALRAIAGWTYDAIGYLLDGP